MSVKFSLVEAEINSFQEIVVALVREGNQAFEKIKKEEIVGKLKCPAEKLSPDNFIENKAFIKSIYQFFSLDVGSLVGGEQGEWLYIIDQRSKGDDVPPCYVVGAYRVREGVLQDFSMNPNFQLFTDDGFFDFGIKNEKFYRYIFG